MRLKKYKNRKLYNPSTKGYASLEDIFRHVKNGGKVAVTDHKTKTDVTDSVLRQVVTVMPVHSEALVDFIRRNA